MGGVQFYAQNPEFVQLFVAPKGPGDKTCLAMERKATLCVFMSVLLVLYVLSVNSIVNVPLNFIDNLMIHLLATLIINVMG